MTSAFLLALAFAGQAPAITLNDAQIERVHQFGRKAAAVARAELPLIERMLGAKIAPDARVSIVMDLESGGVAGTSGGRIVVSARYANKNPNDVGLIVHELAHAVQAYPKYDPSWLVDGIADYVRFFGYEPPASRPKPNPDRAKATDGYRTTAHFLNWASRRYDANLVPKLNAALRAASYDESLFRGITGKSLTELDAEWRASLRAGPKD